MIYRLDEGFLPSHSLHEYIEDLKQFNEWFYKLQIRTKGTRLAKYIKFSEEYVDYISKTQPEQKVNNELTTEHIAKRAKEVIKRLEELSRNSEIFDEESYNDLDHKKYNHFVFVLREIHELLWIYNGFKWNEPQKLGDRLKYIVGGQELTKDDKDTSSRNYQFELRVASYFSRAYFNVDLSQVTDIVATKEKYKFYIECKRLYSDKKVNERVKEAYSQLHLRLNKKALFSKNFGVAVFDVTKLAFPHQGVTFGISDLHCKDIIQQKLLEIKNKYGFTDQLKNKDIILIWLQIHIPSINLTLGQTTTRFSSIFINTTPVSGPRHEAFQLMKLAIETDKHEFFNYLDSRTR